MERLGSITGKNVMPCLGSRETLQLGSFAERNKLAMPYRTLRSSVTSIQCSNTLKSPGDASEAASYSRDLKVKGPPNLEQHARRGPVNSAEASYVRYLREKGYGHASLQEVKELQAKLGLFQADRLPIKRPDDSFEVSSEASCMRYLKERGYGHASLEEVKNLQAQLGLFHSGPVSSRSGRLEGEEGLNVSPTSRGDVTKGGLKQTPHPC